MDRLCLVQQWGGSCKTKRVKSNKCNLLTTSVDRLCLVQQWGGSLKTKSNKCNLLTTSVDRLCLVQQRGFPSPQSLTVHTMSLQKLCQLLLMEQPVCRLCMEKFQNFIFLTRILLLAAEAEDKDKASFTGCRSRGQR